MLRVFVPPVRKGCLTGQKSTLSLLLTGRIFQKSLMVIRKDSAYLAYKQKDLSEKQQVPNCHHFLLTVRIQSI